MADFVMFQNVPVSVHIIRTIVINSLSNSPQIWHQNKLMCLTVSWCTALYENLDFYFAYEIWFNADLHLHFVLM